jgi:type I restriction enzyme M protein
VAARRNNNRRITTPQSLNIYVKGICDIMRRSNCAGALQYGPELTWMLFLRILDEREEKEAEQAKAVGADFRPSLEYPYRWRDWAAPPQNKVQELESLRVQGLKRKELQNLRIPQRHNRTKITLRKLCRRRSTLKLP